MLLRALQRHEAYVRGVQHFYDSGMHALLLDACPDIFDYLGKRNSGDRGADLLLECSSHTDDDFLGICALNCLRISRIGMLRTHPRSSLERNLSARSAVLTL